MPKHFLLAAACAALVCSSVLADTVTLKNGDKLTGKVGTIADGKMAFDSPVLGEITIDMENVETFVTDEPATIRPKDAAPVTEPIASATPQTVTTASGTEFTLEDVKDINPPQQAWKGSIVGSLNLARGNTDTLEAALGANAVLRRDNLEHNDRFTLGANYRYSDSGLGDGKITTRDNWDAVAKYDRFYDARLYAYAVGRIESDRIANLDYRISPGIGVGYQWHESPVWNFNTEAGVSYVYEKFDVAGDDTNEFVALRLAYHYDRKLTDDLLLFHNLEWLPAFEDPGDYILTTDLGLRVALTEAFFTEFKTEWKRDTEPAPGSLKNDLRYLLGFGWQF